MATRAMDVAHDDRGLDNGLGPRSKKCECGNKKRKHDGRWQTDGKVEAMLCRLDRLKVGRSRFPSGAVCGSG
ncbi:hypothetical protein IG631_04840 [Alternaria alternata]|nr:hypothetical protein IG631_04840 [Alternaria alternata]